MWAHRRPRPGGADALSSSRARLAAVGQAVITALTRVASGMAKNMPQNPQIPPNTRIAVMMAIGCRLVTLDSSSGASTLPSMSWMMP